MTRSTITSCGQSPHAVLEGMGIVFLHSRASSRPWKKLTGHRIWIAFGKESRRRRERIFHRGIVCPALYCRWTAAPFFEDSQRRNVRRIFRCPAAGIAGDDFLVRRGQCFSLLLHLDARGRRKRSLYFRPWPRDISHRSPAGSACRKVIGNSVCVWLPASDHRIRPGAPMKSRVCRQIAAKHEVLESIHRHSERTSLVPR